MKNLKIKLLALGLLTTVVVSSTPVLAASNVQAETNGTKAINTTSTTHKYGAISNHQPGENFSGRLWCTGNDVNVRNMDGEAVGKMNMGDNSFFYIVSNGKAYMRYTYNGNTSVYTVDVAYLSIYAIV